MKAKGMEGKGREEKERGGNEGRGGTREGWKKRQKGGRNDVYSFKDRRQQEN